MTDRRVAKLSGGGQVELTYPLTIAKSMGYPESWRVDHVGTLINLAHVVSIEFAEPAQRAVQDIQKAASGKKLVALIDVEGDRWYGNARNEWFLGETGKNAHTREAVESQFGPAKEVWE